MNKNIFPMTDRLLYSMGMRYRHDLGFFRKDDETFLKTIEKMKELYQLYESDLSDIEIHEKINIDLISIKQIREETNGEGFYKESQN